MKGKDDRGSDFDLEPVKQDDKELLKKIIRLLLNKKEPVSIYEVLNIINDKEKARSVLENHKEKFSFHIRRVVDLKLKVDICKDHCSKQKRTDEDHTCSSLHICKFYASSGSCQFGRRCIFGHDLSTKHNRDILDKNYLTGISLSDLNYLFKQENNRIVPDICKFYNVDNDKCMHSGKETMCQYLHICRHFVNGTCKFGKNCRRSHEILDSGNLKILQNHGIDTGRKQNEILKELRKMLKKNKTEDDPTQEKNESLDIPTDNVVNNLKKKTASDLHILFSSDSSDDETLASAGVVRVKKEEMSEEESQNGEDCVPYLQVSILSDHLPFRYQSQMEASGKKTKGKQGNKVKNMVENGYFAEVSITNYEGKATILAYCVDCDGNIHPFNLHGKNCQDGVYTHKCSIAYNTPVKLFGDSILTALVNNYEENMKKTDAYLQTCGVTDNNLCKLLKDKQYVYLKVIAFLDDQDNRMISALSTIIKKKSNAKDRSDENSGIYKRAFSCPDNGENAKRRRMEESAPFERKRVFESCISGQNASTWGNFIDTCGYEESALTWQAHGEVLQSVCMIVFPGGTATGFRVGNNKNYIMTAAHVVDFIGQSGLRRIGRTSITSLNKADIYAVFGYLKEGEMEIKNKFLFNGTIHFQNADTDTAILELSESVHGTPMPPPLIHFRSPDFSKEFFFVGHSDGKPLFINKVDKIVDMNSKESKIDRANVRQWSINHTKCPLFPEGRKYELDSVKSLSNKNRFLFHCKFTKGASGSPGIVCLNDGRKAVVTMLLCGYPEWYYDPSMEMFKANWSKDALCVEQGVKIQSVYNIMKEENAELCHEIFGSETDN